MSGEDETPIVESKPFPGSLLIETGEDVSSTSDTSPTSPKHFPSASTMQEIPAKSPAISPETDMSASYHEIFDTQMPGSCAIKEVNEEEDDDEETANTRLELPLICCDNNTISTTEYLTSKLVEDSLKWQNESKACGSSLVPSPRDSPMAAKKIRPQNISDDIKRLSIKPKKMDVLDPTAIDDIEKHARYLAACVDSMVENLSGVLQSASALTVETLETHRDGASKTCDEADNNIKSMYQLMAKVEELNKSMGTAYRIGDEVKEIRRLVEVYETLL